MRLNSLDSLRGLAALAVIVYHFQHMLAFGQPAAHWIADFGKLPFHAVLSPIYVSGWMAVDVFFCISGYIFFWLYGDRIRSKKISFQSFSILRMTRLYPLHILTLAGVGILQLAYAAQMGSYFVYPNNSAANLLASILFVQGLVPGGDTSFNGPSWSISIEIAVYIVFFLFASWGRLKSLAVVLGLVALGLLAQVFVPVLGRGVSGFFLGGLVFLTLERLAVAKHAKVIALAIVLATMVVWAVTLVCVYLNVVGAAAKVIGAGRHISLLYKGSDRAVMYVLFPLTVLSVVSSEKILGVNWKLLSVLGDISYSSYLLHFPLQLCFALCAANGLVSAESLRSGWSLAAFLLILLPLSWLIYEFYEMPMQALGRRLFLGKPVLTPVKT